MELPFHVLGSVDPNNLRRGYFYQGQSRNIKVRELGYYETILAFRNM